jgi:quercetin dioxygenase-like cupin family protein
MEAHMGNRGVMLLAASVVVISGALGVYTLSAQPAGPTRTILQKSDVSAPGREVVQALVEIPAGARSGKHTHPGEEVGYVLEGTLVLTVDGKPPAVLKAGDSFFVEAGQPHEVTNEERAAARILGTYMVEKGKPLARPVVP